MKPNIKITFDDGRQSVFDGAPIHSLEHDKEKKEIKLLYFVGATATIHNVAKLEFINE